MEVKEWDKDYFDKLDWVEVPMWKALKVWANNEKHVKCVEGSHYYFYHGQEDIKRITSRQVKKGRWFVVNL